MTTIAYNHKDKQVAVDSRMSSDGVIMSDNYDKTLLRGLNRYVMAGAVSDLEQFVDGHVEGKASVELDCSCFLIREGKVFSVWLSKGRYKETELLFNDTKGSGCEFALAAMDHGKTAKQAVQYAATRDVYTGGKVRVFNV